jgi:glycosyltransferase involved in cell wall biosynthesis
MKTLASSEAEFSHTFTVFTPCFNRAHTLHRVYESLDAQTFRDFEWLIVDDGSTDETASLVEGWQRSSSFNIRYLWQENRGKHIAFNHGVREARGELFLTLDSDDACVPEALERLRYHWDTIPAEQKHRFSAVTSLCMDQHGRIVGDRFPRDVTDSDSLEIRYRYGVGGEKWGFHRTAVLREFPFSEEISRQYVPESTIWSRIARAYRTRFVNEALRIYFIDEPSMVHGQQRGKNALGGRLYHLGVLNDERDYFRLAPLEFFRSAGLYSRYSFHLRMRMAEQVRAIRGFRERLLWLMMLPAGLGLYLRDCRWRASS